MPVTPAIPASQLVNVVPSVLSAGGSALDLIGLILTQNTRPPIGQVLSFPNDGESVADYFGPTSQEAALASIYFLGFNNSTAKPGSLLFAQYPEFPVAAYLRGGGTGGLTLAALQAINASLTVTIDGTPTTQSINLATATSFSNAAEIIGNTLGIEGPQQAVVTASLSGSVMTVTAVAHGPQQAAVTASLSSTTMTVTAVGSGRLAVGQVVVGTGITAGTTIAALGSGTGGTGTYTLSQAATTESAESITAFSPIVALQVGQIVSGTGITAGTYIASFGTGAGGVGTYNLSAAVTTESAETISVFAPGVTFDPILAAFVVSSGTTGASSSVGFASGAAATSLLLTQATGAVQSPGAGSTDPLTFMASIIDITQDFVSFMTTWEGTDSEKVGFANWTNSTGNRYLFCEWDTNVANTQNGGPGAAWAEILAAEYSGVSLNYSNPNIDTVGGEIAAFVMGTIASIDFTRRNGRITLAYKAQSGFPAQVFTASQAAEIIGYGGNLYGDYTTSNESFTLYQPGQITGPFKWTDSYVDQVWLNNQLQLAILNGLANVNSVPYNAAGYTLIEAFCLDPINEAVNAGVIVPGVQLSQAQAASVNSAAGVQIDQILTQRGWYLQVVPAIAQVRAARGSPPCTLWYCDGGSIQKVTLASIEIQ